MKKLIAILLIMLLTVFIAQCGDKSTSQQDDPQKNPPADPSDLTAADKSLAEAGNKFGLKLFREIVAHKADTNIFISPLSVSMALGMTYNGAVGETRDAIQQTLELGGLSLEDVNNSYKNLIDILSNLDPKVIFEIANSIWYRDVIPVKQNFLDLNQTYFNSEVSAMDFDDPDAVVIINDWVDDKTHGKISKIIDPPIDPMTIMFLINAIYFKGDWTYQFEKENTIDDKFFRYDDTPVDCRMMVMHVSLDYYENEYFQAVNMPYGDGDFSMTVFLPKTANGEDANSLAAKFTDENLALWLAGLEETEIDLLMPKFEIDYGIKLNDALSALGMEIAFIPGEADFTNIADMELYINQVRHKSYVKVDEEGTEAAAVTIVEIWTTSMPDPYPVMDIDHPFLFVIREHNSNSILFMGKIVNPGLF